MGQVLVQDNLPDLVIASTTTITMATTYLGKQTRISVGGQQYLYSSVITINFATIGINGLDTGAIAANTLYYIYAVQSSNTPGLVASLAAPTTGPTGFTAWKEVGRCRTLSSAATLAAITNRVGGASSLSLGGSDWQSYTPNWTGTGTPAIGNGTLVGNWRRVVSNMELIIQLTSGTSTTYGSGSWKWDIPSGYTILSQTADNYLGDAYALVGVSSQTYAGKVERNSSTLIWVETVSGGAINDWGVSQPAAWTASTANQRVMIRAALAISEFTGLYT